MYVVCHLIFDMNNSGPDVVCAIKFFDKKDAIYGTDKVNRGLCTPTSMPYIYDKIRPSGLIAIRTTKANKSYFD